MYFLVEIQKNPSLCCLIGGYITVNILQTFSTSMICLSFLCYGFPELDDPKHEGWYGSFFGGDPLCSNGFFPCFPSGSIYINVLEMTCAKLGAGVSPLHFSLGFIYSFTCLFPKIGGQPPKWMVYSGKPY